MPKTPAKRQARREAGVCTDCGRGTPVNVERGGYCAACREKARNEVAEWKDRKLAANPNACRACLKADREPGGQFCEPCLARHGTLQRARRGRAHENGLCIYCRKAPQAVIRGRSVRSCQACHMQDLLADYARFGLTEETYRAMGDACHICGSTADLNIDHDHDESKVRGLLCRYCNNGLGMFRDSPELLTKAAAYVVANKKPRLRLVGENQ